MDPIALQRQIRNNSNDLVNYFEDLKQWGESMKRTDEALKTEVESTEQNIPIPRDLQNKSATQKPKVKKKPISSFDYTAWDKFDVEAECAKIDGKVEEDEVDEDSGDLTDECDENRIEEANYEKDKGNKFVKHQKWDQAIECYTKAIEYYGYDPIFYANRALCYLKILNYKSAESDCTTALQLDKTYVKAYQRRAAAREALNQLNEARGDLLKVFDFEPNNKESKVALSKLEKKLDNVQKVPASTSEIKIATQKPNKEVASETFVTQRPKSKFTLSRELQKKKKIEEIPTTSSVRKIEKDVVETEKPKVETYWPSGNEIQLVQAVNKPPHLRSRKSLKRVEIRNIEPVLISQNKLESFSQPQHNTSSIICNDFKIVERTLDVENSKINSKEQTQEIETTIENSNKKIKEEPLKIGPINEPQFDFAIPDNSIQFCSDWKVVKNNNEWKNLYLQQINPRKIPDIFKETLDSEIFSEIIQTLSTSITDKSVYDYLVGLSNVKRFTMLTMFMSEDDKKELLKIAEYMKNCLCVKNSDVDELMQKYGV